MFLRMCSSAIHFGGALALVAWMSLGLAMPAASQVVFEPKAGDECEDEGEERDETCCDTRGETSDRGICDVGLCTASCGDMSGCSDCCGGRQDTSRDEDSSAIEWDLCNAEHDACTGN